VVRRDRLHELRPPPWTSASLISAGVLFAHVAVFTTLTPGGDVQAFWLSLDR
jgi:hypothetical protein